MATSRKVCLPSILLTVLVIVASCGSSDSQSQPVLDLTELPVQPDDVPFPSAKWQERDLGSVLSQDDAASLEAVVSEVFSESTYGQIEAVLLVSGGEIVLEEYGRGFSADQTHVSWSVGKSVTHAMLGILVREGKLDIYEPAIVPEWSEPDDPRAAITPDMLARMSSGLVWNEGSDALAMVGVGRESEVGPIQATRELEADPDTVFNYSTGSTAINGRIIGDIVGTGDAFEQWADAELFEPLGIRSVELELDKSGYFIGGYGANMTARDFARFGLLYQRKGVWDGEQVLPEGWVDYARTPSPTSEEYGSGFWLSDNTFSAAGFMGQRVIMIPENDLIVVILASEISSPLIDNLVKELVTPFEG